MRAIVAWLMNVTFGYGPETVEMWRGSIHDKCFQIENLERRLLRTRDCLAPFADASYDRVYGIEGERWAQRFKPDHVRAARDVLKYWARVPE